jgi:probable F420-dependent oxidoreductase
MRVGVCLPNFPFGVQPSREAVVEVARAAERLGFASVWATDHLLVPSSVPRYGPVLEALATLAHLAAVTDRVELGTSVLVLPQRNAVEVARQAATVDVLADGRLVLGVGAGWIEGEFANLGADFHGRGRHLDEALAVLRTLWTAPDPRHRGDRYRFADVLPPRPARAGGVPLWVGGNSDAALRRAATLGDAWHADGLAAEQLTARVERLRSLVPPGRRVAVTVRRTVDLRAGATAGASGSGEVPVAGAAALREELAALERLGVEHVVCQLEHGSRAEHLDGLGRLAAEAGLAPPG